MKRWIAVAGLVVLAATTVSCSKQELPATPHLETAPTVMSDLGDLSPAAADGFSSKKVGETCVSGISGDTYQLVFVENFDGTVLNENNWTVDHLSTNADLQAYTSDNVTVQDGVLLLTAKKEKSVATHSGTYETYDTDYTSGKIISKGKVEYQYGRFEIYARAPWSQGVWPAFWTMGSEKGWPWCGEIDIFEMVGGDDVYGAVNREGSYSCAIHWCDPDLPAEQAWGGGASHNTFASFDLPNRAQGGKLGDQYHVYGMEWTPTYIITYMDNQLVGSVSLEGDDTKRQAFHSPHYMLLNLALGGSWAMGDHGQDWEGAYIHDDQFPQHFMVDWVKIWQKKG